MSQNIEEALTRATHREWRFISFSRTVYVDGSGRIVGEVRRIMGPGDTAHAVVGSRILGEYVSVEEAKRAVEDHP